MRFQKAEKGPIVPFDASKITNAVLKAMSACGLPSEDMAKKVTRDVMKQIGETNKELVTFEEVQDLVERALMKRGLYDIAKAYILYREDHARARKAIKVRDKTKGKQDVTDASMLMVQSLSSSNVSSWDRNKITQKLVEVLGMDMLEASSVAKEVENHIIGSGMTEISSAFIRETVNSVLASRGYQGQLKDLAMYQLPREFIDNLMFTKSNENSNIVSNNPEAVSLAISETILRQYALDAVFSPDLRKAHMEGRIHIHDVSFPHRVYCSSHSIEYIKKYGLKGLENLNTESKPARTASVLTGHLNTFLASMQANYAGALGLGYMNILYAPMVEGMTEKQLHQTAQELVFNGSQNAFSRGGQTLFLDFNIHTGVPKYLVNVPAIGPGGKYMAKYNINGGPWQEGETVELEETTDDGCWALKFQNPMRAEDNGICAKELKDGIWYHDQDNFHVMRYGDYQEWAQKFAHALLDVWGEGDARGRIFEFPKCDFHVNTEAFTDKGQHEVFQHACKLAAKNGSTYFVFDRDSVSLASCCFTGDTPILVRGGDGAHVQLTTFKELADAPFHERRSNLRVMHNGGWSMARLLKLSGKGKPLYRITTVNHAEQTVTCDHIVPTIDGDKRADTVTCDDYILFNTRELDAPGANQVSQASTMTYAQGVLIGAYLGDGSMEQQNENWKTAIQFSLNKEKYERLLPYFQQALKDWGITAEITLHEPYNNVYPVYIGSQELCDAIRMWVSGKYCYEKNLNIDCLRETPYFRHGIIDGYYETDGGNSNRIYTTSTALLRTMEAVFTSLGMQTIIDESDRTGEGKVEIRGQQFNRNYPVYCIRWYDNGTRRQYPDLYLTRNNSVFYKVASIEKLPETDTVYCFEITDNNEPYFTLPNGIITHNCRLKVQITDMSMLSHPEHLRSVGFQNVTINIPQAAYRAARAGEKNLDGLFKQMDEAMDLAMKAHLQKKEHIAKLMCKGGPLWQLGKTACDGRPYLKLEDATYIIGMIGVNDAVQFLTGKQMHEDKDALDMGLRITGHMFLKSKEYTKQYGLQVKLEESPAESAARRLAKADLVFYRPEALTVYKGGDEDHAYYTNSIHMVADADIDLLERAELQAMFNSIIEAGAITHAFIGEQEPSWEAIEKLVRWVFLKTQSAQMTFSPEFTCCNTCGKMSRGLHPRCPICDSDDVVGETRIVGYFSKLSNFNLSKLAENGARDRGRYHVEEVQA